MKPGRILFLSLYLAAGASSPCTFAAGPSQEAPDVEAREAYILGHPPRVLPLDVENMEGTEGDAVWAIVRDIWKALALPPQDDISEYFATMARHPKLMEYQVGLSSQLFRGDLRPRDRELAILRTAWLSQAPYEWGEHVQIGKRDAGFSSVEIENITIGSSAENWDEHERAILSAVEELHANAMISDETWKILASGLDDRQLLELPVLIGTYQSVAYLQNAVRFRLRPGNPGLSAR